jgi:flavorubredoxin
MKPRQIREGIHWVGAIDWTRRLFDELIPLPEGTSYNAYVVQGRDRTALIDTVEPEFAPVLFERLAALGVTRLDYVIANHAEQDHSGSLPLVLERFPEARVVSTPKCRDFLVDLLPLEPTRFDTVADGATLDLGGRTLELLHAPWVHWPETMLTYLREDRVLFPCDLFGSHVATSTLFCRDEPAILRSAKRYYAEIMMPFRQFVTKHLDRLATYPVDVIAPSHGVVYDRPAVILDAYREWVQGPVRNHVVLPYVSMHGSTYVMVRHLIDALIDRGVPVTPFNLSVADLGELAMALVDAATLVLATSTVLGGAHPKAVYAAYLTDALRPRVKHVGLIGSFGWGGRTAEQLKGLMPKVTAEWLDPVLVKGVPRREDLAALDRLADQVAERHQGLT